MLQVVEGMRIRQGRRKLERRHGDLVCGEKEEGAEGCTGACCHLWNGLSADGIDYAHQSAEGVVNGAARFLLFFAMKMSACRFGDLPCHNLCGVFSLGLFLLLLHLLVSDLPTRFVIG